MISKLSTIQPGKSAIVNEIADSVLRPKLMEMGVINGQELTVLFRAPFGDPIAVDVNGYMLSLRLDEAALIQVVEINEQTISF
jgi:Fe2+ transport system protein FeoA